MEDLKDKHLSLSIALDGMTNYGTASGQVYLEEKY